MTSRKWTIGIFLAIVAVMIPWTLIPNESTILKFLINSIILLIAVTLLLCSITSYKRLARSVLILHIGSFITMTGSFVSSLGFVGTVNVHEGLSTKNVYRWDKKQDVDLGFTLHVDKIHREYYPTEIKVGVLEDGEKKELIQTWTGKEFELASFVIQSDSLDLDAKSLLLKIYHQDGSPAGSYETNGEQHLLPDNFPYSFQLVAFKTPELKRIWIDITIKNERDEIIEQGISEINHPFKFRDLRLYLTQVDVDQYGNQYAGVQMVKDPGLPFVYAGFVVMGVGGIGCLFRTPRRKKKKTTVKP